MSKNSRLVYSTEHGRVKEQPKSPPSVTVDGIIRIARETKGRKGAGVSLVSGFDLLPADLKDMAKKLKKLCGCGGTLKDGVIEIQGDHRETIQQYLESRGFTVKRVGG